MQPANPDILSVPAAAITVNVLPKERLLVWPDITSAMAVVSPAQKAHIQKAEPQRRVPAAALCTPARAAILAPAVQQTERAPDLIPDPDLTHLHLPPAVQAAVRRKSDTPASTALKLNVCMKDAPPALRIR